MDEARGCLVPGPVTSVPFLRCGGAMKRIEKWRTAALVSMLFVACRRPTSEPAPPGASAAISSAPPATDVRFLDEAAKRVVAAIADQESTKDVTCWTSFRQLDSFISSGQYSNFAVLAKISAMKALVRASWERASR